MKLGNRGVYSVRGENLRITDTVRPTCLMRAWPTHCKPIASRDSSSNQMQCNQSRANCN